MSLKSSDQPPLATYMLTFMVRGLLSGLEFPYAQFASSSMSGELLFPLFHAYQAEYGLTKRDCWIDVDQLYSLVWGCVRRLEACGFKVIALMCHGAEW